MEEVKLKAKIELVIIIGKVFCNIQCHYNQDKDDASCNYCNVQQCFHNIIAEQIQPDTDSDFGLTLGNF